MAMATSKQLETQAQPQLEIVTAGKFQKFWQIIWFFLIFFSVIIQKCKIDKGGKILNGK